MRTEGEEEAVEALLVITTATEEGGGVGRRASIAETTEGGETEVSAP